MADWLEIRALLTDDQSASASDLRRALVASGVAADDDVGAGELHETEEVLVADAFTEVEDRAAACPDCYPFALTGTQLRVLDHVDGCWGYVFCLLLSYHGLDRADAPRALTELFEEVSEIAARRYVSGESVKFGFPRRVLPAGFMEALNEVCRRVGEGEKAKARPDSKDAKDARLDIVAWRPFPDRRKAQLVILAQCAAGGNWDDKLTDLQARSFTDLYMMDPPAADPVKGFFTPFRVARDEWYTKAKYGGILFDRCRIAHLVCGQAAPEGILPWIAKMLDTLRTGRTAVAGGRLRTLRPRRRRTKEKSQLPLSDE